MDINFGDKKKSNRKSHTTIQHASFEDMLNKRKEMLPEFKDEIQKAFKDYNGESFSIIIMKEDENGKPCGSHITMAGVSGLETQVAMAKKLNDSSEDLIKVVLDQAKGDPEALLQIAKAIAKLANQKEEEA